MNDKLAEEEVDGERIKEIAIETAKEVDPPVYRKVLKSFFFAWLKVTILGLIVVIGMTAFFCITNMDTSKENIIKTGLPIFAVCLMIGIMIFPLIVGAKIYHPIIAFFTDNLGIEVEDGKPGKIGQAFVFGPFTAVLSLISLALFFITSHLFFPYALVRNIILASAEKKGKHPAGGIVFLVSLLANIIITPLYWLFIYFVMWLV